eukprot:g3064.t1
MEDGILLGFLGGPPCETWSKASGQALPDGSSGPRIVRSLAQPSGLPCLTKREDDQVSTGSRLLSELFLFQEYLQGRQGPASERHHWRGELHRGGRWAHALACPCAARSANQAGAARSARAPEEPLLGTASGSERRGLDLGDL